MQNNDRETNNSNKSLIPPPTLWKKLVLCTQRDTQTDGHMDGQSSWFQNTPENIRFAGYNKLRQVGDSVYRQPFDKVKGKPCKPPTP